MRLTTGVATELESLRAAAGEEFERIASAERARGSDRAAFVFTYHVYYKSPDLLGLRLAAALSKPYLIAEASLSPKRAQGEFAPGFQAASDAIVAANVVFALTGNDRAELEKAKPAQQRVMDLKPFLDLAEWPALNAPVRARQEPPRLLTVAMMRPGDKESSYRQLAAALALIKGRAWTLDVVGDGADWRNVKAMLAGFGERIRFHGQVDDRTKLSALYAGADAFVWPGVNEAFGMSYLEAQAHGVPCIAARYGGVPDVIRHGETGFLTEPGDIAGFADAIQRLCESEDCDRMRIAAARFVHEERSLEAAAQIISDGLAAVGVSTTLACG